MNELYNNFNRIKTLSNILSQNNNNKKKNISKKRKIKVKNSKHKKMKKSINIKFNLTNYIFNSNNNNKNSRNKILSQKLNTFSYNSSTPKLYRFNDSNGLLIDTDINKQIFAKNYNFTYSNNFNEFISNNSNLDVNVLKS